MRVQEMIQKYSARPTIGNLAPITGIVRATRRRALATTSNIGSRRANVDNRKTHSL